MRFHAPLNDADFAAAEFVQEVCESQNRRRGERRNRMNKRTVQAFGPIHRLLIPSQHSRHSSYKLWKRSLQCRSEAIECDFATLNEFVDPDSAAIEDEAPILVIAERRLDWIRACAGNRQLLEPACEDERTTQVYVTDMQPREIKIGGPMGSRGGTQGFHGGPLGSHPPRGPIYFIDLGPMGTWAPPGAPNRRLIPWDPWGLL